jgi:hypothetical protein
MDDGFRTTPGSVFGSRLDGVNWMSRERGTLAARSLCLPVEHWAARADPYAD